MKKISMLSLAIVLAGCASTNYSEIDISEAELTNLEVEETHDLSKREHEINVSFDYSISGFNATEELYYCSVQFAMTDDKTITRVMFEGRELPCILEKATGSVSISWPSPLDKSLRTPDEILSKIKYPIEYFVAIHQKTSPRGASRIIGSSEVIVSNIRI